MLKLAAKVAPLTLTRVCGANSLIHCNFSFHCEVAFSNREKVETCSLFENKMKEIYFNNRSRDLRVKASHLLCEEFFTPRDFANLNLRANLFQKMLDLKRDSS